MPYSRHCTAMPGSLRVRRQATGTGQWPCPAMSGTTSSARTTSSCTACSWSCVEGAVMLSSRLCMREPSLHFALQHARHQLVSIVCRGNALQRTHFTSATGRSGTCAPLTPCPFLSRSNLHAWQRSVLASTPAARCFWGSSEKARLAVLQLRAAVQQPQRQRQEARCQRAAREVGVVAAAVPALRHQPLHLPATSACMFHLAQGRHTAEISGRRCLFQCCDGKSVRSPQSRGRPRLASATRETPLRPKGRPDDKALQLSLRVAAETPTLGRAAPGWVAGLADQWQRGLEQRQPGVLAGSQVQQPTNHLRTRWQLVSYTCSS